MGEATGCPKLRTWSPYRRRKRESVTQQRPRQNREVQGPLPPRQEGVPSWDLEELQRVGTIETDDLWV